MADPAAPDGSDAADDDDECEGVAYMFDAAAATERRSLALDHGAVRAAISLETFERSFSAGSTAIVATTS